MPLQALFLPFHLLFSRHDAGNAADPEKEPTTEEEQGRDDNVTEPSRSTLNTFMPPFNPRGGTRNDQTKQEYWPRSLAATFNAPIPTQNQIPDLHANGFRVLPLISGVFVPFAILLAIPGLTEHWYIRTNALHQVVEFESNPLYLRAMLAFSMACAVVTNICLLIRLLEKMVKKMTFICIAALSVHDILDAIVIIMFIIKTQKDDGFILGQAFWMTLCSTLASLVTNVTLILDYWMTSDSERHRSGLTGKQRSLTIIIIVLLCYVALGAAVHAPLLSISFVNALYFTVVCIETVGFGDIDPKTPGARIFSSLFTTGGIVILAVAIGLIREALLEAIQANLYARIRRARKQRIIRKWKSAVQWRLENAQLPVWVPVHRAENDLRWPREMEIKNGRWRRFWWRFFRHGDSGNGERGLAPAHSAKRMRLNLMALSEAQLQAAAMEAGAPLPELLPHHPYFNDRSYSSYGGPEVISPTHHRLGHMTSVLRNFAYAVSIGQSPSTVGDSGEVSSSDSGTGSRIEGHGNSADGLTDVELEREERRMFAIRITFALGLFLAFWLAGSAIFMATEKWSFWLALYFCFLTFSTVGYGDPAPQTPAGRSVFVGWALCGIATMAILISLLADRYSERYKTMISSAESKMDGDRPRVEQGSNNPPPPPTGNRVTFSDKNTAGREKHSDIGCRERFYENEEVVSRLDSLKALVVDEGAHKDDRFLHTLESELQSMLLLARRSRKQPSRDE